MEDFSLFDVLGGDGQVIIRFLCVNESQSLYFVLKKSLSFRVFKKMSTPPSYIFLTFLGMTKNENSNKYS